MGRGVHRNRIKIKIQKKNSTLRFGEMEMASKKVLSLVFVRESSKILLGYKKRGYGKGWWNGFGGKVEKGETIIEGALRWDYFPYCNIWLWWYDTLFNDTSWNWHCSIIIDGLSKNSITSVADWALLQNRIKNIYWKNSVKLFAVTIGYIAIHWTDI